MAATAPNILPSYIPNKVVRAALSLLSERKKKKYFPGSPITPSHSIPNFVLLEKTRSETYPKTD